MHISKQIKIYLHTYIYENSDKYIYTNMYINIYTKHKRMNVYIIKIYSFIYILLCIHIYTYMQKVAQTHAYEQIDR